MSPIEILNRLRILSQSMTPSDFVEACELGAAVDVVKWEDIPPEIGEDDYFEECIEALETCMVAIRVLPENDVYGFESTGLLDAVKRVQAEAYERGRRDERESANQLIWEERTREHSRGMTEGLAIGRREALGDVRNWLSELTTSTRNRVASKPWSERREGYADGVESVEGDFSALWPEGDDA